MLTKCSTQCIQYIFNNFSKNKTQKQQLFYFSVHFTINSNILHQIVHNWYQYYKQILETMLDIFNSDNQDYQQSQYINWSNDKEYSYELSNIDAIITNNQNYKTETFYSQPINTTSANNQLKKIKGYKCKHKNPNLLKNLVTTLRSWINITQCVDGKVQAQLWKYFKYTKKINKQSVWLIYGNIDQNISNFETIKKQLQCITSISVQQYKKIQNNIKIATLTQLRLADIEYILKYRRIHNREEFNAYFYQFIKKLESEMQI